MLTGENGVLTKGKTAKKETEEAQEKENQRLEQYEEEIEKNTTIKTYIWEKFNTEIKYKYTLKRSGSGWYDDNHSTWTLYDDYEFSEENGVTGIGGNTYVINDQTTDTLMGKYYIWSKEIYKVLSVGDIDTGRLYKQLRFEKVYDINKVEDGKIKGSTTNEIVESTNRDEYPNSGEKDEFWYEYKGEK